MLSLFKTNLFQNNQSKVNESSIPIIRVILGMGLILWLSMFASTSSAFARSYDNSLRKSVTYKAELGELTDLSNPRLDWRNPKVHVSFELPASDWVDSVDLHLSVHAENQPNKGVPLYIHFNDAPAMPVYPKGHSFTARITMDKAFIKARRNVVGFSYSKIGGCIEPSDGSWTIDLDDSLLLVKSTTPSTTFDIGDVKEILSSSLSAPSKVSIVAKGSHKVTYEALIAQGTALNMTKLPRFSVTAGSGDMEIYEPHSFAVTVNAEYQGKTHHWQYDNFEGRTKIEPAVAAAMSINTEVAGEATLTESIEVFGKIVPIEGAKRDVSARFDGQIKQVYVVLGQSVEQGDKLLTIESNESLKSYTIVSPINGVVLRRTANVGEQSQGRTLLSILNPSLLTAELSVFGGDQQRVKLGAAVQLKIASQTEPIQGKVKSISPGVGANQARTMRVDVADDNGLLTSGQFVTGRIDVAQYSVPLAVKRIGLQSFRDFTVVYAKVGDEYEVRMLELGRQAGEWVEVLGGLQSGTEYVTDNSFIIKADIEKSGASHDH